MNDDTGITFAEQVPAPDGSGAEYVEGEGLWTGGDAVRAAIQGRQRHRPGALKKLRKQHEDSVHLGRAGGGRPRATPRESTRASTLSTRPQSGHARDETAGSHDETRSCGHPDPRKPV